MYIFPIFNHKKKPPISLSHSLNIQGHSYCAKQRSMEDTSAHPGGVTHWPPGGVHVGYMEIVCCGFSSSWLLSAAVIMLFFAEDEEYMPVSIIVFLHLLLIG